MQTVTLKARTGSDGIVRLEVATELVDKDVEIVLVMQPVVDESAEATDAMGYPIGYFDRTYGSFADEPLERDQPLCSDTR